MDSENEVWVAEVCSPANEWGYGDRFDIEKMYVAKGNKCMELTGEEARQLYQTLKPPMAG
jgi:hypothetical protein